jgi:hypothetical protein
MSVWLRKTRGVPGSAPGGLQWHTTEDVVEVEDVLAGALLEIPDAGFVSVAAPEQAETPSEPEGDAVTAEPAESGEQPAASKPARKTAAARTKTQVQE